LTQASNDLEQLKQSVKDLSNVYKSQLELGMIDNDTLTNIHNAILKLKDAIYSLKKQVT